VALEDLELVVELGYLWVEAEKDLSQMEVMGVL
jgi:hypothetical protein